MDWTVRTFTNIIWTKDVTFCLVFFFVASLGRFLSASSAFYQLKYQFAARDKL